MDSGRYRNFSVFDVAFQSQTAKQTTAGDTTDFPFPKSEASRFLSPDFFNICIVFTPTKTME